MSAKGGECNSGQRLFYTFFCGSSSPLLSESLDEGGWCSILRHHFHAPVMDLIGGWKGWVSGKEGESGSDGGARFECDGTMQGKSLAACHTSSLPLGNRYI